jgi:hypothetical protein
MRRQRSLQYFTLSQTFSHFLRQLKGRLQTTQVFCGRNGFLCAMALRFEMTRGPQQLFGQTSWRILGFIFGVQLAKYPAL